MTTEGPKPICFVIAPIGDEDSEIRRRSDQVLTHIIKPAASECGYEAIRADQISEPGIITSQVIQHIVDDALVVADLTGRNPNVFYELALRHALKKPVVQIIHYDEAIPFDVAASRTIHVNHHDLDSAAQAKNQIVGQIKSVEVNPENVDSPISVAMELQLLRQSENPLEQSSAEIISMIQDLRSTILEIRERPTMGRLSTRFFDELIFILGQAMSLVTFPDNDEIDRGKLVAARDYLERLVSMVETIGAEVGLPRRVISGMIKREIR